MLYTVKPLHNDRNALKITPCGGHPPPVPYVYMYSATHGVFQWHNLRYNLKERRFMLDPGCIYVLHYKLFHVKHS